MPFLASAPKDPTIYEQWVGAEAPTEEKAQQELRDVKGHSETDTKEIGETAFLRDHLGPYLEAHVIRGFFKSVCWMMRRVPRAISNPASKKWADAKAYKKAIDRGIFVLPDQIRLRLPPDSKVFTVGHAMHTETQKGGRDCLMRSEAVPVGTVIEFDVLYYKGTFSEELLREWFDHGRWYGLGRWRGSGQRGRFTYEMIAV